jgi:hypothetical protein
MPLLKCLGHCEHDKITVLTHQGYRSMFAWELVEHFNCSVPVDRIRPVFFFGGPGMVQYRGDYLTFIVDRAMSRICEKGWAHVNATILYCERMASVEA